MGPVFLIAWIGFAFLVGVVADNKGRNGVAWGLLALIFSPLLTILVVLALGRPGPNADTHKRCPACAEWVANEARICKHCGNNFMKPFDFGAESQNQIKPPEEFRG